MVGFSELTDDLLIKILSFVPTRKAVGMSTLSKRWLPLWKLVPRLTFEDRWEDDDDDDDDDDAIPQGISVTSGFVSGVLLLHKSPFLESFHLSNILSEFSASEIYVWVSIAVDRFVRHLKISFSLEQVLVRFPSRLFTCETLETLELERVAFLDVPSRLSLRSLRTLRLVSVRYADEESFLRLISSSPLLENLVVTSCSDGNVETFTINLPSLRSLTVQSLRVPNSNPSFHRFVIHSHSLNQLSIVLGCGEVDVIGKMTELVEASLHTVASAGSALKSLTSVKCLTLASHAPYPIGTIFSQLVRLDFLACNENWSNLLVRVLQHSPILEILKLDWNHDWDIEKEPKFCWIQPSCVPGCLLSHLKTFMLRDYQGSENEKQVAIYILKNARQLESTTVFAGGSRKLINEYIDLRTATSGFRAGWLNVALWDWD